MTKAYFACTTCWQSTAIEIAEWFKPALRQLRYARSFHFDAQTPAMAAQALAPSLLSRRSPGHGKPSSANAAWSADATAAVGANAPTASLIMDNFADTSGPPSPSALNIPRSRCASAAFSCAANTSSNVPYGSAADAGNLIQSGSLPRKRFKLQDFPPTMSKAKPADVTACRPAKRTSLIARPGCWSAAASETSPGASRTSPPFSTVAPSPVGEGPHVTTEPCIAQMP
mmetsp:Transcript_129295/g.374392  ORF Transcript_129295/g.374392 Transcript_129295/m.374392 type:complete len:228 (+) Transcript_129295:765-1448(+)